MMPVDVLETQSTPPDWESVPFDVACARCGHDLHGLAEPICPACGLEFDWADAVPIEQLTCLHCGYHLCGLRDTRCPECGEAFTWSEVLTDYRARQKSLFEYRWRDRAVRSFVRTWLLMLRPGRLWRTIDIHDPPQVIGLFLMNAGMLATFALTLVLMYGIDEWVWQSGWIWSGGALTRRAPRIAELPLHILQAVKDRSAYYYLLPVLCWMGASFLALMVFPQSMRLCKVRIVQVFRVWAYALLPMVPVACLVTYAYTFAMGLLRSWYPVYLDALLALVVLTHATWSLRCGYRLYLRMRHGAAVAVASQIIAVLAGGLCEFVANRDTPGTLFFQLLRFLGLG